MKFAKTLTAAVLLAGASVSAQASPLANTSAFLEVYNGNATNGQSYALNLDGLLGKNNASMLTSGSFSVNLSADANWTSFATTLSAATAQWTVVSAGIASVNVNPSTNSFQFTTRNATPLSFNSLAPLAGAHDSIVSQIGRINTNTAALAAGNSIVVADANTSQGGWALDISALGTNADNLWAQIAGANAGVAYGSTGNFYNEFGSSNKVSKLSTVFTGTNTLLGTWNLTGNTLTYTSAAAPAAVPLPAAVWMFGAGLMGVLRLTRRKSAAI